MSKALEKIENEIANLQKPYRTIKSINKADGLYLERARELFKDRTGKKIARGFDKSPEYRTWKNSMYRRRGRFKERVVEDIEEGTAVLETTSETESSPYWDALWYKNRAGEVYQEIDGSKVKGGDFTAVIKETSGGIVQNSETIKSPYALDRKLKSLYLELRNKKMNDPGFKGNYFFTKTKTYQVGDLTIIDIEIEMDS